jgi:peptide chain release factor 1
MFDKLEAAENRYEEVSLKLGEPSVIANQEEYKKLMKEFSDLEEVVTTYREYRKVKTEIKESKEMLSSSSDRDFCDLIQEELKSLEIREDDLSRRIKVLLVPKDPNDEKSVIVEIRGGAGGEEAALFASVLFRMYSKYAEKNRWKVELLDANETEIGGFKEVVFSIDAKGAYSRLKFESGVHRVQRVPSTESSGRIHTSTVTVAVLPEVEEVEIDINPNDLEIDTFRASGAGGQHINKTDSAIRITHIPSGFVVKCQDERSQHKNKDKAMKVLRSKLFDFYKTQQDSELAQNRKNQVGTGDRSERIRTYNYPQGRVTDHRIGLTLYKIEEVLNGDIDEFVDALITTSQSEKLANNGDDGFDD